jgi:hypothetical protein
MPTVPYVLGTNSVVTYNARKYYTYFQGERVEFEYAGPTALIEAMYPFYKIVVANSPQYDSVSMDPGKGVGRLTATYATDGPDTWELLENEIMKPILQHPSVTLGASALTPAQVDAVRKAFEKRKTLAQAATLFGGTNTGQYVLFNHLIHGVEELPHSEYVLRCCRTVTDRSVYQASFTNVNRVVTLPSSAAIARILPTSVSSAKEWLYRTPIREAIKRGKFRLGMEWWSADKWSYYLGGTWLAPSK